MNTFRFVAVACAALTLSGCATTGEGMGASMSNMGTAMSNGVSNVGASVSNMMPSEKTQAAWAPTVDTAHLNQAKYDSDLAECRALAEANPAANQGEAVKRNAVKGGVAGAAAIGALAIATGGLALLPMAATAAATYGAAGAAAGAGIGAMNADAKYKSTITQCLTGRGYKVIQ